MPNDPDSEVPAPPAPPARGRTILVLTVGVLAMSSASTFVRLAHAAAGENGFLLNLLLGGGRLALASLLLLPAWISLARRWAEVPRAALGWAALSGVVVALHFATWFTSLSLTTVAASTVLVTLGPVWTAIIATRLGIERLSGRQWLGIAVSLAGALVIGLGDAAGAPDTGDPGAVPAAVRPTQPLLGDLLALAGGILAAVYRLLARAAQRAGLGTGEYAAVAYGAGGLALLPWALLGGTGFVTGRSGAFWLWLSLLAIVPQLIGHTSANWAVRWFSPTLVSMLILFEPVVSSVMAWLLFHERIGGAVWLGGAMVLAGVALAGRKQSGS